MDDKDEGDEVGAGVEDGSDDDMWASAGGGWGLGAGGGSVEHKCRTSEFRLTAACCSTAPLYRRRCSIRFKAPCTACAALPG